MRRSRQDIMATVLEVAKEERKKTHLMYKASLSSEQLKEYIRLLTDLKFLEEKETDSGSTTYKTTIKGGAFLERYKEMSELCL